MGKSGGGSSAEKGSGILPYVILCLLTCKTYLRVTQKPAGGLQRELISRKAGAG